MFGVGRHEAVLGGKQTVIDHGRLGVSHTERRPEQTAQRVVDPGPDTTIGRSVS